MWVPITIADVKSVLSDTEYDKITNAKLAPGQTGAGVVLESIARVVRMVRGKARIKNSLGQAGTIPDEVMDAALAILRQRIFTRIPNVGLLGEDRRSEVRDANALLRDLAKGDLEIESPAEESDEISGATGGSEVVMSRPDNVGGSRLSGL